MEEERVLAVFERKIPRKIYGPVKENELWRIRRNDELEDIIKGGIWSGLLRVNVYDGLVT
jgi:hypothetical protein